MSDLFGPEFVYERRAGDGIALAVRHNVGEHPNRPPLLLLHGFPQTHAIWHKVASALAQRYTLVMPDLRGYGDSDTPPTTPDHAPYSKRAMAADMAVLMRGLGYEQFFVCGHDRGGRVAHRLALDFPQAVRKLVVLDISPTATMYTATNMAFARAYYHWFFLIQPAPLPETLIGGAPGYYLHNKLGGWGSGGLAFFDPRALAEYERCFTPATIHAMCEDYRAAAGIDLQHDAADERIQCPVHVLWGERGVVSKLFAPIADWQAKCAAPVTGRAVPGGHFIPEELPDSLVDDVFKFAW
ncbi:MAG: alpha/beta fold hydrolase [Betaproteobacteria bacterium]